ncbi:hypothetical protein EBQ90_07210 [bacterium]|nr:hypothetical protein [bacterium]
MDLIIGIDQTGAASQKGKNAKPLPVCVLGLASDCEWRVVTEFRRKKLQLKTLSPNELEELLTRLEIEVPLKKVGLAVDCVLGLPRKFVRKPPKGRPYLWEVFREAAEFNKGGKEFGRDVAEAFFQNGWLLIPRSILEELVKKFLDLILYFSLGRIKKTFKQVLSEFGRNWVELPQTGSEYGRLKK